MKEHGNIIAIEVHEINGENIDVVNDEKKPFLIYEDKAGHSWIVDLPKGSYTFICTNRDATEEQKREILWHNPNMSGRDFIHAIVGKKLEKEWLEFLKYLEADQGTKALLKKD
jgi:hypothetical protein